MKPEIGLEVLRECYSDQVLYLRCFLFTMRRVSQEGFWITDFQPGFFYSSFCRCFGQAVGLPLKLNNHKRLKIIENPNSRSDRSDFEGNKTISSSELKKILSTKEMKFRWFFKAPLDETVFSKDLERIQQFYVSQGFYHMRLISHEIQPLVGNNVRILIRLEEGPPMMVSELDLKIDGPSPEKWRKEIVKILPIQAGKRFTTPGYKDIEKAAKRYLAERGYPKAKVDLRARLDKGSNLWDGTGGDRGRSRLHLRSSACGRERIDFQPCNHARGYFL